MNNLEDIAEIGARHTPDAFMEAEASECVACRQTWPCEAARLHASVLELEALADLRWKADMRAIKRWQGATGRELVWPDHADLLCWLLEREDQLVHAAVAMEQAATIALAARNGRSRKDVSLDLYSAMEPLRHALKLTRAALDATGED